MLSRFFKKPEGQPAPAPIAEGEISSGWKRIVIPASGNPFSLRSICNTSKLAAKSPGCEVQLLYVQEVPRAYALQAPMPGDDAQAQTVLADGLEEARRWGLDASTEVLRVREAVDGLIKHIEHNAVDLIVIGSRPDEVRGLSATMMAELMRRAPCEVIVDYIASEQ